MTRHRISRRSLLAATGASSLLLPLLQQGQSYGAESVYPLRIVFVVTSNGTVENAFWPTGSDGNITLPEITSPLEVYKQRLLFTRGIDFRVWAEDNPFGGNGDAHHDYGCILTGTKPATGDPPHDPGGPGLALASSRSIDHHIAEALDPEKKLPFRPLAVRARGVDGSGYGSISWSGERAPFSAEGDPRKLFDSLFAGVSGDHPDPALVRLRKKRQSVLDYVGTALERQAVRLGSEDRHKIQLHLDAVRNIERQLQGAPASGSCEPPSVGELDYNAAENFPTLVGTQMDLITAALACNLTRVATLAIADSNDYDLFFPWLDIQQQGIEFPQRHHHDISHRPGENDHEKIIVENWFISQMALLLDKLSAVPEGEGTLLDNTIVVWLNSLNNGFSHTVFNVPWIIAGGENSGLRTGGRVKDFGGEAHNKLLAALSTAVGAPLSSWGDERYSGLLDLS